MIIIVIITPIIAKKPIGIASFFICPIYNILRFRSFSYLTDHNLYRIHKAIDFSSTLEPLQHLSKHVFLAIVWSPLPSSGRITSLLK